MIAITDRLVCVAHREADMAPMLVFRDQDHHLVARSVPHAKMDEACRAYGFMMRQEPELKTIDRYVHVKSNGVYRAYIELVRDEAHPENDRFVLYQSLSHRMLFLRPKLEFMDGRFRALSAA